MRSTVDLEDILDKKLRKAAAKKGLTFKQALNQVVAAGLKIFYVGDSPNRRAQYKIKARSCGIAPGVDHERLNSLVDELEIGDFTQPSKKR